MTLVIVSSAVRVVPNIWFWLLRPWDFGLWSIMKKIRMMADKIQVICSILYEKWLLEGILDRNSFVLYSDFYREVYSPCSFNNAKPKPSPIKVMAKLIEPAVIISFPIILLLLKLRVTIVRTRFYPILLMLMRMWTLPLKKTILSLLYP